MYRLRRGSRIHHKIPTKNILRTVYAAPKPTMKKHKINTQLKYQISAGLGRPFPQNALTEKHRYVKVISR
jgi:hypothetical protein